MVNPTCTAQELYRQEKARRGLGPPVTPGRTWLHCPRCKSETIVRGRIVSKSKRKVRCADCGHGWVTQSREAFGGWRRVEVRG